MNGVNYLVNAEKGTFAAAMTDGDVVVITRGPLGRAGRSSVTHVESEEEAISMLEDFVQTVLLEGYHKDVTPHLMERSLRRHLRKEPLAKLQTAVKIKPVIDAFI